MDKLVITRTVHGHTLKTLQSAEVAAQLQARAKDNPNILSVEVVDRAQAAKPAQAPKYLVLALEERHDFNHGRVWYRRRARLGFDTLAEAERAAVELKGGQTTTDILVLKGGQACSWRSLVPTLDGSHLFWKRHKAFAQAAVADILARVR